MTIRPGTKYVGSSYNDTGAYFIEFIAATDDVALLELVGDTGTGEGIMRIWLGTDSHNLSLLGRPAVDTTLTLSDTGWYDDSTGGAAGSSFVSTLPTMTGETTGSVTITGSGSFYSTQPWWLSDDDTDTQLRALGFPYWIKFDFGAGNTETITKYTVQVGGGASYCPTAWALQGNDVDTGSDASWTNLDTGGDNGDPWDAMEKREYTISSPSAYRFYRWRVTNNTLGSGSKDSYTAEVDLFKTVTGSSSKTVFSAGRLTLNATATGSFAIARKKVIVSDTGSEHSLAISIGKGPVTLRVGSTLGTDDLISETALKTGYHNLSFTPEGDFHITVQSKEIVNRVVSSMTIGDSGTVEVRTPWAANDVGNVRSDQSADVVFCDCIDKRPQRIERRGTGRSWSVVDYKPTDGPFIPTTPTDAKLSVSDFDGNSKLTSDIPYFTEDYVGAIFRLFHEGQGGRRKLAALNAKTDAIEVIGISDTGDNANNERRITFDVSGTYEGEITIERSPDGDVLGFKTIDTGTGTAVDTGTFTSVVNDPDNNLKVFYRARMSSYTSGTALIDVTYKSLGTTGVAEVTGYNSNTDVDIEIIKRFSDTGPTDNWQDGYWSDFRGYPTSVALHGGRLCHAKGGMIFMSVSDDYESFNEDVEGDAGPIVRSLGSGPVDNIRYIVSLARPIVGTDGAEISIKSSSLDEPITPDNSSAIAFSTQGSANLRAVKMDQRAIFVQRSKQRVFMIGSGVESGSTFGDYEGLELTLLVPDFLESGIVSIAIQRQPDTRIHCVLADGTVGILTYEPKEEVICWSKWTTDGAVEQAMVLPGIKEDAVYYHIRRTINGATKRYLEKWALESECVGDTGLSWLMDCAASYTDTGRTNTLTDVATHLVGENVVAWGDLDTGTTPFVDLSPDVSGTQTTYAVDTGGDVTLSLTDGVHHAVVGLPYAADWKSSKLAYGGQGGTALSQMKRVAQMAFVLYKAHNRGLEYGADTGYLDKMPQIIDDGAQVDQDKIFETFDQIAISIDGTHGPDERIVLRAKAPRPMTVLAAIPSVQTNERV